MVALSPPFSFPGLLAPLRPPAVSRIVCRSDLYEMNMKLDVNVDVYPLAVGEKFTMTLASTLSRMGAADDGTFSAAAADEGSLIDVYDYVMHGKIFKLQESQASQGLKCSVYVSFGGLLMLLTGEPKQLASLELDKRVYLLIRKV